MTICSVRCLRRCACWARMLLVSALLCLAAAVYRPNYPLAKPVTWEMFGGAGNYSRDLGITLEWSRWDGYFLMNWTLTPSAGGAPRWTLAPVSRRSRLLLFVLRSAQRRHFRLHLCLLLFAEDRATGAGWLPPYTCLFLTRMPRASSLPRPAPPRKHHRLDVPPVRLQRAPVQGALCLTAFRSSPEGGLLVCRRRHHRQLWAAPLVPAEQHHAHLPAVLAAGHRPLQCAARSPAAC